MLLSPPSLSLSLSQALDICFRITPKLKRYNFHQTAKYKIYVGLKLELILLEFHDISKNSNSENQIASKKYKLQGLHFSFLS